MYVINHCVVAVVAQPNQTEEHKFEQKTFRRSLSRVECYHLVDSHYVGHDK